MRAWRLGQEALPAIQPHTRWPRNAKRLPAGRVISNLPLCSGSLNRPTPVADWQDSCRKVFSLSLSLFVTENLQLTAAFTILYCLTQRDCKQSLFFSYHSTIDEVLLSCTHKFDFIPGEFRSNFGRLCGGVLRFRGDFASPLHRTI